MADENYVNCYNRGCGLRFIPEENNADACCFHPGEPIFHDAYKGWSCCNKRTTDFNEFLSIKGCKVSFHSEEKPPEREKAAKSNRNVVAFKPPEPGTPEAQRPPIDTPFVKLEPTVSTSLKNHLESLYRLKLDQPGPDEIRIGTVCSHPGCKEEFRGHDMYSNPCVYHSGDPVFHEGMKYWSCCNRKTTDFAAFLEQKGCTVGDHLWEKNQIVRDSNVRYDWHQTGNHVFISVYGKLCDPNVSTIEVNPVRVKLHLEFLPYRGLYDMDIELMRMVDSDKCEVLMMPTKVELKLKKAYPGTWPILIKKDLTGPTVDLPDEDDAAADLEDIN